MYLMEVREELDYSDFEEGRKGRQRKWFELSEAVSYLKKNKIE